MTEGYKETELGEIPKSWEVVPIYELRNKADRYSFTGGPFGSDLKSEHYTAEGVKVIQLQDIGEGVFIDKSNVFVTEEKADDLSSCNIFPEDIILAKMAPVARCCMIPEGEKRYVMSSDGIRLSVDKARFNNSFVFQALNSTYFRKEAEAKSTGTTRARIGLNELKLIPIALPINKKEQQKIADILSTVDEKIEVIEARISQTEELKKGLMQQLLTKGIGHTKLKNSELGEIPESWEVVKLGDVFKLSSGEGLPRSESTEGDFPVYGGNGVSFYHTEYTHEEPQIIIGRVGAYCGCIHKTPSQSWITDNALFIREKLRDYSDDFLYYVLNKLDLNHHANKNAQPVISGQKIYPLQIGFPGKLEQENIASILKTVDEKLEVLKSKKETFEELKKGLMQTLLTGKVRVKVN